MKEVRGEKGWTLIRLSFATQISVPDLSAIENGTRHAFPGWRKRICRAFCMSEEEVFPCEMEREVTHS